MFSVPEKKAKKTHTYKFGSNKELYEKFKKYGNDSEKEMNDLRTPETKLT